MKIIEDWIDENLTSLVSGNDGFIIMTDSGIEELALAIGLTLSGSQVGNLAVRDHVYYLVDQHKDYFQQKLEEFGVEYAKQEIETHKVETM
jgi:hypothetical protein